MFHKPFWSVLLNVALLDYVDEASVQYVGGESPPSSKEEQKENKKMCRKIMRGEE